MTKQKDKLYMPMGTGGLLKFSEEEKVILKVTPKQVIILVAIIVVLEVFVKIFVPLG
jgi:preprotein translocase subunit Sec61beta